MKILSTAVACALALGAVAGASPASAAAAYKNCAAMHQDYPHGVGKPGARDKTSGRPVTSFTKNKKLYDANTKSDRDKDGIACEKR